MKLGTLQGIIKIHKIMHYFINILLIQMGNLNIKKRNYLRLHQWDTKSLFISDDILHGAYLECSEH